MKKKDIVISLLFLIYAVLGCSYVFFPDSTCNRVLSTMFGFAHLYSFSTLIGCIVIIFSVLMILISVIRKQWKSKTNIANPVLILTIVLSVVFIFGGTENKTITEPSTDSKTIKLVEWNVADKIDETNIQKIFGEFDADIAVLPELEGYEKGDQSNKRLADLFQQANIDFGQYDAYMSDPTEGHIAPVTVVIKRSFGNYHIFKETPMTRFGTVYLSSASNNRPSIIGLHTAPPLTGLMSMWKRDLDLITDVSEDYQDAIIIGDFNATMKHGSLSTIKTHEDVLAYAPEFNSGTWNTDLPSIFRTRIDHILIPKNQYHVKSIKIETTGSSDHLCVFTEIQEGC